MGFLGFRPEEVNEPLNPFNIRGVLESAHEWGQYYKGDVNECVEKKSYSRANSRGSLLKRMEEDGYIDVRYVDNKDDLLKIESMALTGKGFELLLSLREKDTIVNIEKNVYKTIGYIFVTIILTVLTTLITLLLSGKL